jgi:glutamine amidotransferase
MKIAIVQYNAGNIQSVLLAIERLGLVAQVTNDIDLLSAADKIIFPGVGEASTAMKYLEENKMDAFLKETKQPVLGICLGMQLMCAHSEEGNTKCLNIFNDINLKRFAYSVNYKVPQVGWNEISFTKHPLFDSIQNKQYMYNVHSYYAPLGQSTIATCNYGITYSAALQKNNFYGVQFHPEKSGDLGSQILNNFITKCQ